MLILVLGGLLWLFGFFTPRNYSFAIECFKAEKEQRQHFVDNKTAFYDLVPLVSKATPIDFDIALGDTLFMTFQDSSIYYTDLFIDSTYKIRHSTKTEFLINDNNCLEVINKDTMEVCNHNWQIRFYGHYKDKRIDRLLDYYGWTRPDFEKVVEKVQGLNCYSFSNQNGNFGLRYNIIHYRESASRLTNCFGHSDGYFDYLYTTQPDSFYWKNSLDHYEENFYGIEHWTFW